MAAKKKEQNTPDKALYLNENGERLSVEECFREIEGRIGALEDEELPLEEAFARYSEGMALIRYAGAAIDAVEQQVQQIAADGERKDFE
ncbi:MAG: exodeoxyribonuclease VII small subunit [Butyrivibrio sp.]|nr:exodeoxyribonuclease VII small subunit [Butyrivibrio sp.]